MAPDRRRRAGSMELLLVGLTGLALSGSWVSGLLTDHARLAAAATVFCGVFVQALPFLVLGVIVSGLVAAYVTPERLARWLPRRPALAVAVAGVGGAGGNHGAPVEAGQAVHERKQERHVVLDHEYGVASVHEFVQHAN